MKTIYFMLLALMFVGGCSSSSKLVLPDADKKCASSAFPDSTLKLNTVELK
ncbi:MAG: hypothetical protein LWX07_09585 [Bacteroidetes bacterium]|nr:hypothetical protein [Bacteroidota bacterium]